MTESAELGFIGAGNMATALCRGVVRAGLIPKEAVVASDPDEGQRARFEAATGVRTTADNGEPCRAAIVVLAVKPHIVPAALAEVAADLSESTLVISAAAGVPTERIEAAAAFPLRVVRAMPNTPMLVGEGAAALCKGRHATDGDLERATQLFATSATVLHVDEPAMHAVTAVSGSGPAYAFYLAERMAKAGIELGLPEDAAVALANKTILGAGRMLTEAGRSAEALRKQVTTPGGTTAAAIGSMEADGVGEAIIRAVKAAAHRSEELAEESG